MKDVKLAILSLFILPILCLITGNFIFNSFFKKDLKDFSDKILKQQLELKNHK